MGQESQSWMSWWERGMFLPWSEWPCWNSRCQQPSILVSKGPKKASFKETLVFPYSMFSYVLFYIYDMNWTIAKIIPERQKCVITGTIEQYS